MARPPPPAPSCGPSRSGPALRPSTNAEVRREPGRGEGEPAGGELARLPPPNERDCTGTRGHEARRVGSRRGRRRLLARALAVPRSRPSAPPCQAAARQESLGEARPGEDGGGVRLLLCSSMRAALATCPGEQTLARLHAGGLAYLISRCPPTNLASLALRPGCPGPGNARGSGRTPGTPPSDPGPWPGLPPPPPCALEARLAS